LVKLALAIGLAMAAGPAAACRLALVLAIDVSSSVDAVEDILQRQGLAAALRAPAVADALFASPDPVAIYAFEWSGQETQVALTPGWVLLDGPAAVEQAAAAIAGSVRSRDDLPTAIGRALGHAAVMLRDGPDCLARTIDVAGDGENNESFPPRVAYDNFPFDGITVNALVVTAPGRGQGDGDGLALISYFREQVIHGTSPFVIATAGYGDYAAAMEAKLIQELALPMIGAVRDARLGPGPS
jgi:hypothetical protein